MNQKQNAHLKQVLEACLQISRFLSERPNFLRRAYLLIILGIASSHFPLFSGCGSDDPSVSSDCQEPIGQACAMHAGPGGSATWNIGSHVSSTDYVVIIQSRENFENKNKLTHSLTINPSQPARPWDKNEETFLSAFKANDYGNRVYSKNSYINAPGMSSGYEDRRSYFAPHSFEEENRAAETGALGNISSGETTNFVQAEARSKTIDYASDLFTLKVDLASAGASNEYRYHDYLAPCLERVIGQTYDRIGKPYAFINQPPKMDLLITNISDSAQTVGQFASQNLFRTQGGKPIVESLHRDILFATPIQAGVDSPFQNSAICSTLGAHEMTHAISYTNKTYPFISPDDIGKDKDAVRGLAPIRAGHEEGLAHFMELMSGEYNDIMYSVAGLLENLNEASFALETSKSSDKKLEIKRDSLSRALNTLFFIYAWNRSGGTFALDNSRNWDFARKVVTSAKSGPESISDALQVDLNDLYRDFFLALVQALHDPAWRTKLMPEPVWEKDRSIRGLKIMSPESPASRARALFPYFHPYQADLPLLSSSQNLTVPVEGIQAYRYRIPTDLKKDAKIKISGGGAAISVYVIPVNPWKVVSSSR